MDEDKVKAIVHMVSGAMLAIELRRGVLEELMHFIAIGDVAALHVHESPTLSRYINWQNIEWIEMME